MLIQQALYQMSLLLIIFKQLSHHSGEFRSNKTPRAAFKGTGGTGRKVVDSWWGSGGVEVRGGSPVPTPHMPRRLLVLLPGLALNLPMGTRNFFLSPQHCPGGTGTRHAQP